MNNFDAGICVYFGFLLFLCFVSLFSLRLFTGCVMWFSSCCLWRQICGFSCACFCGLVFWVCLCLIVVCCVCLVYVVVCLI